jgi:hypothetical protein
VSLFVELPAFSRYRQDYLDDEAFRALQSSLLANPEIGDVIEGTGGLRKMRQGDLRRGKGKREACELSISGGKQVGNFGYSPCTIKTNLTIYRLLNVRR